MAHITFEQFLNHTNAEEIIVKKMKEAGPKIFRINYDRRLKHCRVLFEKFYDKKLRDTVLDYGLVLKPMPNSFKAKFLQFPQQNNEDECNSKETTQNKSTRKRKNKSPALEDKYKDDLPSTSKAFVHKPRFISPPEKKKTQTKSKLKPSKLNSSKETKSTRKRPKSLEKEKHSKKSPKITNYFTTNAVTTKVDENSNSGDVMKLRKRLSDQPNVNLEIEQQTKRQKMSPVKIQNKNEPEFLKSQIRPLHSKAVPKQKMKNGNKNNKKDNSINKSNTKRPARLYSDDFISDDCDINSNNSVVNLTIEESIEHIPQVSPDRMTEQICSPSKSALPKRNRTENYGNTEKEKEEIRTKDTNGITQNEIELWIAEGQKALEDNEDNNNEPCIGNHHYKVSKEVSVGYILPLIKSHADKVKKYIKYWLKFEIEMRKGINVEATVVSEASRTKFISAFNEMTYEDFKNLINVQRYVSDCTSLGQSIEEQERNLKNSYTAFIRKEKSWPAVNIELSKLQSLLHSKGVKESIPLKNIPPRVLSFDEVLEKTNIKEFISLNCNKPPESYKELLSLCKKQYEKCCCEGVWTDELKFVDKTEESGSSQEMSIELFTEPSVSPIKIVQKELPVLQKKDTTCSSYNVTKEITNTNEFANHSKNSKQSATLKKKKSRKCGPKSQRKHLSESDDDLENQINIVCGHDEQPLLKNTIEPIVRIDTQELNRILAHSPTHPSLDNAKVIPHSEGRNSTDIAVYVDSNTHTLENVENNQKDLKENPHESLLKTKQTSNVPSSLPTMNNAYSDQPNTKCFDIQITDNNSKPSANTVTKDKPLKSPEIDRLMSFTTENSTDKHPQSPEKGMLIPPSPNLFQSSGESYSKSVDSHVIEVTTQEIVYVPCEINNDFHTEQNNFSISIFEASKREDPFCETIENQDKTIVEKNSEQTNENRQIPIGKLNSPSESSSIASKDMMAPKDSVLVEPLKTSDIIKTHIGQLNVSEESTPLVGNSDTKEAADSEETIVLNQLLLSNQTVLVDSCEISNNHKQRKKKKRSSIEPCSNPSSYEASVIVDSTLEPSPYLNIEAVDLAQAACNKGRGNSVSHMQPDVDDMDVNLNNISRNRKKKHLKKNVQKETERNPSISSMCSNITEHQGDLNADGEQSAKTQPLDHTASDKAIEKNPSVTADFTRNTKVVVKREIFSQYDDDVQIIDIPQSEAIIIDDEETAPELLAALLCNSPQNKPAPMTIIHTSIPHVTPSSIYLDNFPQAQQLSSNFDLTQSQSNLNQSSNEPTNAPSGKAYSQNLNNNFKTPNNNATNCSANIVSQKSPCSIEATENRSELNAFYCKQKTVSKKPCSSKSKDDLPLSEEMSEMSYVSIAPQNIPSDIDFTQSSSNNLTNKNERECLLEVVSSSEEGINHVRKQKNVCIQSTVDKQNKQSGSNSEESGMSMVVCLSESFDETNKFFKNSKQSKNIKEHIKSEESLELNKIPDFSPLKQSKNMDTIESSKLNSGVDEEVEQDPYAVLAQDSLDRSSDVEFLEENVSDDTSVEISSNKNIVKNEKHDRKNDGCCSSLARTIAQKHVLAQDSLDRSSDVEFLEESASEDISVDISSHDKKDDGCFSIPATKIAQKQFKASEGKDLINETNKLLVIECKKGYAQAYGSKNIINNIEILEDNNESNTAENAISSLEVVLSGDVELLEENEVNGVVDFVAVEADAETFEEPEDQLHNIKESVKPLKPVGIPKVNILKTIEKQKIQTSSLTAQSLEDFQNNRKIQATKCHLTNEEKQFSNIDEYPEGSNSVIIEKLLSKDSGEKIIITPKSCSIGGIQNSTAQILNVQCNGKSRSKLKGTNINYKKFLESIKTSERTSVTDVFKVGEGVGVTSLTTVPKKSGNTAVLPDGSSVNIDSDNIVNNDLQFVLENIVTKEVIQSEERKNQPSGTQGVLTFDNCKSLESSENLSNRNPITEVCKNIDEIILPTNISQEHDKSGNEISPISENPNNTIDVHHVSSESLPRPSLATSKHENVDENSKDETCEHTLKTPAEVLSGPSRALNEDKNTAGERYSQSFGKVDKTNGLVIITSTQVELPVSDQKENQDEKNTTAETSPNSSVEFIDFSFYYTSSDDGNNNQNDGNEKEEKFSHTKDFRELSKILNDPNNQELIEKLNVGSEGVLEVNIPSINHASKETPKNLEASTDMLVSEIILNKNKAESSCNVLAANPAININLSKSYDSAISNDSKKTNLKKNVLESNFKNKNSQAALCEHNSASNKNPLDGVIELQNEGELEKTTNLSKYCEPVTVAMSDTDLKNRQNIQSSKSSISQTSEQNTNVGLNVEYISNKENSQLDANAHLIDEQLSCEDQGLNSPGKNQCIQGEDVDNTKKISNKIEQQRTTSEQPQQVIDSAMHSQPPQSHHTEVPQKASKSYLTNEQKQPPNNSAIPLSYSQTSEVRLAKVSPKSKTTGIPKTDSEHIMSTKLKPVVLQGYIPIVTLQNIQTLHANFVEVPILIEKRLLNTLPPLGAISESMRNDPTQKTHVFRVNVELKLDEQLPEIHVMSRKELKIPRMPLTPCEEKEIRRSEEEENVQHNNPSKKLPVQMVYKGKRKILQPPTSKKKSTSTLKKKSSQLPDYILQKTHAFQSIPLKTCNKPPKSKPSSLLSVEECDYRIEDASQSIPTTSASQILGTDCTYFENSELLRNLDEICISHHPQIPELQIEQLPEQLLSSSPTTCKVINFIPITLSEGVTARKVWQVNLHWKSHKAMTIEVRFSVNRRSMIACDESAKRLFTFTPDIWSDVHRVLREIDHFEYKRRAWKNGSKTTPLHKVLKQLFDSSIQVVDVKLINDSYNPFTICEKTVPLYRKPFQCLTKGIDQDILSKMRLLKETLQNNNSEIN